MTAFPGGAVTITFQADLTAAYQAYQAYLAYVAANPPRITAPGGGGPGGGGGGGGAVAYNYITNHYSNTYNRGPVTINRPGTPPTGRGGRGGGRRGGGRGRGGFGRLLSGYFLTRELGRIVHGAADYNIKSGQADSELARYKAEEGLQRALFGIPIVGQVAELATLPYRAQTENTIAAAEAQDRQSAQMQRSAQFEAGLARQGAADAAGASGSDPYREQEIENRRKGEIEKVEKDTRESIEQVDRRREEAKSAITAAQQRYEVGNKALSSGVIGGMLGQEGRDRLLAAAGIRKPDVAGEDAAADADAAKSAANIRERDARNRAAAEEHAKHEREELDYQRQMALEGARQRTEIARLTYEREPDVAKAQGIYDSGENAAEASRHRGRPDEAREDLTATLFRLRGYQRDILEGGSAEAVENAGAMSFGETGSTGLQSVDVQKDDTAEALAKTNELIEKVLTEIQAIPQKI